MLAAIVTASVLVGCATSPENRASEIGGTHAGVIDSTATPIPTPTPASVESEPPRAVAAVDFTYSCAVEMPTAENPTGTYQEFASWAEVWAYPGPISSCESLKLGEEYTDLQREAVRIAGDVLPLGLGQLDILYSQCAITNNGYLELTSLAPNQASEVRAFLLLCPDRPGADTLRGML